MKNYLRAVLISCMIVSISSCATMTIEGDGQKTVESTNGTHTVHGSYYSFNWSSPKVDKCKNGRGLYRARYHTNAIYSLVSIISVGLYVPQTVQWWCDGTPNPDDDGDEYDPSK